MELGQTPLKTRYKHVLCLFYDLVIHCISDTSVSRYSTTPDFPDAL